MTAHDGVTSDGRSSHSDRHSVPPHPPKSHTSAVAKVARQKMMLWPGCLSACICSGDGWMGGWMDGLCAVAGPANHRGRSASYVRGAYPIALGLGLGRQTRGSSDEVIKVRQETTRADAISTAGPRVMAQTRS